MSTAEPELTESSPTVPSVRRLSWTRGIAPTYISLFLWIAFFDGLAVRTLPVGGLAASVFGAALGGLLCVALLFHAPAMWGLRTRGPMSVVATRTFGLSGARWVPGLPAALVMVMIFALGLHYGIEYAFRGLSAVGLLDPGQLQMRSLGPWRVRGPLFMVTAFLWGLPTATLGVRLVRIITGLMSVYVILHAVLLGGVMVWGMVGLANYHPLGYDPATLEAVVDGERTAALRMVQYLFAFFAAASLATADWGAGSRDTRDVRLGGLVGVGVAPFLLATVALLAVAGALGRQPTPKGLAGDVEAQGQLLQAQAMRPGGGPIVEAARREVDGIGGRNYTFGVIVQRGIGGWQGAAILLLFSLAGPAPSIYAALRFGHQFAAVWPRIPRRGWQVLGFLASMPLVALGIPFWPGTIFGVLGALIAPVIGALTADYVRSRGVWRGPRAGVNWIGIAAWAVGVVVGLLPMIGKAARLGPLAQIEPAAVLAFVAAFMAYFLLALSGLERPTIEAAARQAEGEGSPV